MEENSMIAYLLIVMLMHVNFVSASAGSAATASANTSSAASAGSAATPRVGPSWGDYILGLQDAQVMFSHDGESLIVFGKRDKKDCVFVYSIDQNTALLKNTLMNRQSGIFRGTPNPIWLPKIAVNSALKTISFDGKIIALCDTAGKSLEVFFVNSRTEISLAIPEFFKAMPIQSMILSPDGQWLLLFSTVSRGTAVMVFRIDRREKSIKYVSLFLACNIPNIVLQWRFSPDGAAFYGIGAAVYGIGAANPNGINDTCLIIRDFNNRTGEVQFPIPIELNCSDVLSSLRPEVYKEVHKTLVKPIPSLLNEDCASVLEEYIVGPNPAKKQEKDSKEELDENQQKMQKTQEQEKSRAQDASQLFAAIKQGDVKVAEKYLTPFTINATNSNYDTPLIQAVRSANEAMVRAILQYQGEIVREDKKPAVAQANLKLPDRAGNTALWVAISLNADYKIALLIAEKMTPQERAMNVRGAPVIVLLLEQAESAKAAKNKADYDKLVKLLQG